MREPRQQTLIDDEATLVVGGEETTLVAPRFDDEETLVARPVVPLDADDHSVAPVREMTAARARRSPYAPRRASSLALVLVSVLVGGVLGGAGLYLYQRQSQDPAATTPQQQPAPPSTEAQAAPTQQPNAPKAEETTPPAHVEEAPAAAPAREPENVPAAEQRTPPAEGTPKHGKKGEHDEELERRTPPQPGGNVARTDGSIFDRPRRATRRTRSNDDVDRLRRIFEGTPQ
jgi:hypothetical protein